MWRKSFCNEVTMRFLTQLCNVREGETMWRPTSNFAFKVHLSVDVWEDQANRVIKDLTKPNRYGKVI